MDEPASALDPIATLAIEDLIARAQEGLHDRDRDAQHAAGQPRERHDRVLQHRGHGKPGAARRDRHDREDLLQPGRARDRGLRQRPSSAESERGRCRRTPALPRGAPRLEEQALGGLDLVVDDARPHARGARAPGHRARVDRHPRRRPHRRALPGGPPGILSLLALQAPVAGDLRVGRRAAARDQARRAHGRPVREHRQDAPARRATSRRRRGDARPRSSRMGALARSRGRAVPSRRSCCATSAVAEDLVRQDREINRLNRVRLLARGRDRHRRRPRASGRCR